MDATVLLLLVCCWKVTEGSGNMGSDVTGETLTTAMDFLIPTTSDQSTLHVSFKQTNTVTDSITIQRSDVTTTSTETDLARYVHLHQDGKTGMATGKNTNTSRDFIEKQRQDLYLLNEAIKNLEKEAVEKIWEFIEGKEENVGHLALNKYTKFVQALEEYVNRSKELNVFIDKQNSSADDELKIKEIGMVENELRGVLNTKCQVEYLFTLININVKLTALIDLVLKNGTECGATYDGSLLEYNVKTLNETIQLLNEHIHVAKLLVNFMETFNLTPAFQNHYTDDLVDLKLWESALQNKSRSLAHYNELVERNTYRLLLRKCIRPVTQGVILIVGFWGNGVLLAVFAMHKDMRTPPNHMVINMVVGDFLSLISNIVTLNVVNLYAGGWHYGLTLCRVYRFVRHLCLGVTVYSVVIISAQRFFALGVFFEWHGFGCRITKKYKSILITAFVWLLASVVAVPRIVTSVVCNITCRGQGYYYSLTTTIDFVALCLVPLVIISVLSVVTARRIKDSVGNMPGETAGTQNARSDRLLSSKVLISLAVVFAVCYVPYFLYEFLRSWVTFYVGYYTNLNIRVFTFSLIFGNSCFNPIAVYLASSKYRLHMNKYLLCKCRQKVDKDSR